MTPPTREQQLEMNEKVKAYIDARLKSDAALQAASEARKVAEQAVDSMQEMWRQCRNSTPGVYSFKEHHRACIIVDRDKDYPEIVYVVV